MPIQSMTGFGRGEAGGDSYLVTAEIKSVNHRFKDIRFKMSSLFNSIELDLKKELTSTFKRGSFDIYLNFKRGESKSKFDNIDDEKVRTFLSKMTSLSKEQEVNLNVNPTDFLRAEFYQDQDLSKDTELLQFAKDAFVLALKDLEKSRRVEGEKLISVIGKHLEDFEQYYAKIMALSDTFQETVKEKLKKRFENFKSDLNIDEPRFLQEVVYYLEKLDVHEEINRIESHLETLKKLTSGDQEIGRQIDFLIQELNRETNTIGSKSSLQEISDSVVQMKIQLEKIREQGLNLE